MPESGSHSGVLLTSFIKGGWALSETSLGIFRGLGAIFGLFATLLFPWIRKRFGLIRGARLFIVGQALILLIFLPFFYFQTLHGWAFLSLILFSRIGLYGFSLGETEIRQRTIPEGQRGRINGVAGAITSFATLFLFGLGTAFANPQWFFVMILISVGAVCTGAIVFVRWSLGREKSL